MRGAVCLLLALAACARTPVRPRAGTGTGFPRPDRILVYPFAVSAAEVRVHQGVDRRLLDSIADTTPATREVEIGHRLATHLAEDLVAGIRELGLPAEPARRGTLATGNALVIDGAFLDVEEGNRLERLVIGLRAGDAAVDTRGQVYRAARPGVPVLEFVTHADGGATPEAAARSADQAVAYLADFFVKHGWIPRDKARKAQQE